MKERITPEDQASYYLLVQWNPGLASVGVGLESRIDQPTLHFIDQVYGGTTTQTEIGRILFKLLREDFGFVPEDSVDDDAAAEYMNKLGRACLDAVTGSTAGVDGLWTWFNRSAINRTIRLLRKARDSAFGRDE